MGTNTEIISYLREEWNPQIALNQSTSNPVELNPLDFWAINKLRYPNLALLAAKYLALQPTETPCESQFSITGYFDSNYRRRKISYKKFKHLNFIKLRKLDK